MRSAGGRGAVPGRCPGRPQDGSRLWRDETASGSRVNDFWGPIERVDEETGIPFLKEVSED